MLTIPIATDQNQILGSSRFTQTTQKGFTLIELMVVVAIIGILAMLAVPSLVSLIAKASVSKAVNNFISDTRYARGEAMRRGKSVTICRSNNPTALAPACGAGQGLAVLGWASGWVVFSDENKDGAFNAATDVVLRVQEPLTGLGDFYAVGAAPLTSAVASNNYIIYDGTGRAAGQQGRWLVHAAGGLIADAYFARTLCMNSVGRVRMLTGEVGCP